MTVRVVTDSCSDITQEQARQMGITVVPAYLRFGEEVYRDGVDIDADGFYEKLSTSPVHPSTSSPSPGDFSRVYEELAKDTGEIVSIHVTSKHSATCDAARVGKEVAEKKGCRIEVVDSRGVTMWQGLAVIAAAKAAGVGCSLPQVVDKVHETIGQLRALALLDTIRYIAKGGRLSRTIFRVESVLNVKPLITLRDGDIRPAGLARNRGRGIERLRDFISSGRHVGDFAMVHSTSPGDAQALADHAASLFPGLVPRIVRLGPALGVHAGPGALLLVLREESAADPIRAK